MKKIVAAVLCAVLLCTSQAANVSAGIITPDETQAGDSEKEAVFSETAIEELFSLSYLVVGKPYITTPDTQTVLAEFTRTGQSGTEDGSRIGTDGISRAGTEDDIQAVLKNAVLSYQHIASGKIKEVQAVSLEDGLAEFQMDFTSDAQSGIYKLCSVRLQYEAVGTTPDAVKKTVWQEIDLPANGINATFGVNEQPLTVPDAVAVSEDEQEASGVSADIVTLDEQGNTTSEKSIEEALDAVTDSSVSRSLDAVGAGKKVVVLDPGHDSSHAGARGNGLAEETLVFKIAQYCKAELETYANVSVYMTRNTYACPYPGTSSQTCNANRVAYAKSVKASVYVALHLNSGVSAARGAEVYYPNSNGNALVGSAGRNLAVQIQNQLVALGLANRGVKIRNSESGDSFADGTLMDYYGVIRAAKKYGIPAVIVEHAFLTNSSDAANFLKTEDGLRRLGVADATGIATYLGLAKGIGAPEIKKAYTTNSYTAKIVWDSVADASRYEVYRSTNINSGYQKIADVQGSTSYKDANLTKGATYYYKIKVLSADGQAQTSDAYAVFMLPGAPITKIQSTNSNSVTVTWQANSAADGYIIKRSTDGKTYTKLAEIPSRQTVSYTDKNVSAGQTYYYRLYAYKKTGAATSMSSRSATAKIVPLPQAVISKAAGVNSSAMKITWQEAAGASGYQIYRSESKNSGYKKIGSVSNALSYQDNAAKAGKTFYYKVRAYYKKDGVTSYGNMSSYVGAAAVAKTSIESVLPASSSKLVIRWKKASGVYRYQLQRATSKNGKYTTIATLKPSASSYTDAKRAVEKKYYYRIRVIKRKNGVKSYSDYSAVKSGSTTGVAEITSIASKAGGKLKIQWNEISKATSYQIYRSTSKKGVYLKIATVPAEKGTVYTDKEARTNKAYYYKVRALVKSGKRTGYGSFGTPKYGKAVAPTKITKAYGAADGQIKVIWNKVPGAAGYRVYRSTSEKGTYTRIATVKGGDSVSYTDKTVKNNKTYYYKVESYNTVNKTTGYSTKSAAVKAKAVAKTKILYAKSNGSGSIQIAWEEVKGADSYQIKRSTSAGGSYETIATVAKGVTEYKDQSVKAGTVYYYRINVRNKVGRIYGNSKSTAAFEAISLKKAEINDLYMDESGVTVKWKKVSGAQGYIIQRSKQEKSGFKTVKKITSAQTTSYLDTAAESGTVYYYRIRAYARSGDVTGYGSYGSVKTVTNGYAIMGETTVTTAQMTAYFNASGKKYPSAIYKPLGAANITEFCNIIQEEAKAEGVKAEVVFAQICNETGFLQFGGDVKPQQCNFAGIGATGGGVSGASFPTVRIGIRAQVQHLKAYASKDALKMACVDPRFQYVKRGCAPFVEWLAIAANPYTIFNEYGQIVAGYGWAANPQYGTLLLKIIKEVKAK